MQQGAEYSPADCLVSVNAQVMAWDDKFSGWIPLDGGGVSVVGLYQRLFQFPQATASAEESSVQARYPQGFESGAVAFEILEQPMARYEYFIFGRRIDDNKVLLNCTLTKDLNYRQVMPTFHHWQIFEEKFGLKFMTSYEACKFHNKLQKAVEHLSRQSKSSSGESNFDPGDLDDEVFVPVDLPLNHESTEVFTGGRMAITAAPSSSLASLVSVRTAAALAHSMPPTVRCPPPPPGEVQVIIRPSTTAASYPYVEFRREPLKPPLPPTTGGGVPDEAVSLKESPVSRQPLIEAAARRPLPYSAPNLRGMEGSSGGGTPSPAMPLSGRTRQRPSVSSAGLQPLILPKHYPRKPGGSSAGSMTEIIRREQCFYCKQYYSVRDNVRGSCPEAPDMCTHWIRRLTCLWCADCLLYCCCRDDDDDDVAVGARKCRRMTTVALLALILPCLWCYPPMVVCRYCCRKCGWVAGRHRPIGSGSSPEYSRSGGEHSSTYK